MLEVERLSPHDRDGAARWDSFVTTGCAEATFFHRSAWQGLLRNVFRHETHYLLAHRGGVVAGVLPLAEVRTLLFGHALVSLPFAVYGGVAATDDEAAAALEAESQRIARRLDVQHLEMRNVQLRHADWPRQDLYVTFRKRLESDDEANLLAIPRKQRAMVRRGIRNGLRSRLDTGVDRFFSLYADNVHRHGTPALPRRWFEGLREAFGHDCDVLTVEAPDGRPLSSVLTFWFRDEVLPYYAGDDASAREVAANDFKYYELMRYAVARGARVFDYGRSKWDTGSFAFKKNWGFEPAPLHYEYQLYRRSAVPQNNPSNGRFRLLIEAWRRLPVTVANRVGPFVVRGLG